MFLTNNCSSSNNTRASLYDPLDQAIEEAHESLRALRGQRAKEAEMHLKEEAHFRDVLYTAMETWKRHQLYYHHVPLKIYTDAITKVGNKSQHNITSPSILQQQAKLCRSLHMMGIIEKQVQLTKREALVHAQYCQRLVSREQDRQTLMEIDLMTQVLELHREVDRLEFKVRKLTNIRLDLADHRIILDNNHARNTFLSRQQRAANNSNEDDEDNSSNNNNNNNNDDDEDDNKNNSRDISHHHTDEEEQEEEDDDDEQSGDFNEESSRSCLPHVLNDLMDDSVHEDMVSRRPRVTAMAC